MTPRSLNPAVNRLAPHVRGGLSATAKQLFDRLLTLIDSNGEANLADVLQALYPGETPPSAIKKYGKFREAVGRAASARNIKLEIQTDGRTRTPHDERVTWFETESRVEQAAAEGLVRPEVMVPGVATGLVPPAGIQYDEPRRPVRGFVVWAHEDETLKRRLLKGLAPYFRNHPNYRIRIGSDIEVCADGTWDKSAGKEMRKCEFGLVLASPSLLARRFAAAERLRELPHRNWIVPVALSAVPHEGAADLQDLGELFRDSHGKAYSQLRTPDSQSGFALDLFNKIAECLSRLPEREQIVGREREDVLRREMRLAADFNEKEFVPGKGARAALEKMTGDSGSGARSEAGETMREDALQFFNSWIEDPEAPDYCALLGEYGMGKTTTCKALTLDLLKRREAGERVPFPIYLDLRNIGKDARRGLLLEEILTLVVSRSWKGGPSGAGVTAKELIDLVEQEGAVVIWDGLDEVLVHLDDNAGRLFTRQLYRIIPPPPTRDRGAEQGTPVRRLLVSCRTHYFRTLREQKSHFLAEDRDNVRAENYRAFLLLPFNEEQIREYVAHTLPAEDPDRVMATLDAVHNLREMAERPYTLHLIAKQFAAIEKRKAEGRPVTGLTLYRHMVLSWLERDTGKHLLTPDHKQALMEHFAAALFRTGDGFWSVADLEQWLIDFMEARPEFAAHYAGKDRELLKEDLRTATFLVRDGEDRFRFAHTSLQEYFLAGFLRRALVESKPKLWELPAVSPETLDFLGQWLLEESGRPRENALASLGNLRDAYQAHASELAFAYFLLAGRKGYPAPPMAGFQLPGADLRGLEIKGTERAPLVLTGANFRDANLRNSEWRFCNLEGADFSGALAEHAEWLDCYLAASQWSGAELEGAIFRQCGLEGASFENSRCFRTQVLLCHDWQSAGLQAQGSQVLRSGIGDAGADKSPSVSTGRSPFNCCAFSPDARRIVSASADNTLRLWDAASGQCLLTLAGHERSVYSCAFSPDARRIVSASADGTLRLWDSVSGEQVGPTMYHLSPPRGGPSWAAIDRKAKKIVGMGGEAWRSVGWVVPEEATGLPEWLPAESFD